MTKLDTPQQKPRVLSQEFHFRNAVERVANSGVDFLDTAKKMSLNDGQNARAVAGELNELAIKLAADASYDINGALAKSEFGFSSAQQELARRAISEAAKSKTASRT